MNNTIPNFPDNWTYGHSTCFIYFTFAEITDGELAEDEMSVIRTKIAGWNISAEIGQEAYDFFRGKSYETVNMLATRCWNYFISDENFTKEIGQAVIGDLKSIANADGKITEEETTTIAWFESTLEDTPQAETVNN